MRRNDRALLRKVDSFLRRNQMEASDLGRFARNDVAFVARLRNGISTSPTIERQILTFMERYDRDPATAHVVTNARLPSSAERLAERVERDQGKIEAERAILRAGGDAEQIAMRPVPSDPVARVAMLVGPETPAQAIQLVASRWPSTWADIVKTAREERVAPGAMMMRILEEGLAARSGGA